MRLEDYNEEAVHNLFDQALRREQEPRSNRVTMGTVAMLAQQGGYTPPLGKHTHSAVTQHTTDAFDLSAAKPLDYPHGIDGVEFAGPKVGDAKLFPLNALSLFVALGGGGKTTTIVTLAAHIAAGTSWGTANLTPLKAIIFSVEESQKELNRKFGAATKSWVGAQKQDAIENLRMISLAGHDPRLTRIDGRSIVGTDLTQKIINTAQQFGAGIVFLDHLQGFTSGDLNNSDTATALAREVNQVVFATGAAVVMAAHINKGNISAQEVSNGFTTGSLAFENAARQVVGIIPLPDADTKRLGLEALRRDFMLMAMPKNSYGPSGQIAYLRKVYVPDFHTITVVPFEPTARMTIPSASERLKQTLGDFIKANPGQCSKNAIEKQAGKKGPFKASKAEVRAALGQLVEEGILRVRSITREEKSAHGYPHQTKEVYEHV